VYETARSDLGDFAERGLLKSVKVGETWLYTPVDDLENKRAKLA
jgi:hypothetical protein